MENRLPYEQALEQALGRHNYSLSPRFYKEDTKQAAQIDDVLNDMSIEKIEEIREQTPLKNRPFIMMGLEDELSSHQYEEYVGNVPVIKRNVAIGKFTIEYEARNNNMEDDGYSSQELLEKGLVIDENINVYFENGILFGICTTLNQEISIEGDTEEFLIPSLFDFLELYDKKDKSYSGTMVDILVDAIVEYGGIE